MTAETERRAVPRPRREPRRRARETALQMLYQWEVGRAASIAEVGETFWLHDDHEANGLSDDHRGFAVLLAEGVVAGLAEVDPIISEAAENWRLERMNVMDRLILRLAVFEFLHQPETPARVVINEALELARTFSTDDSVRFINGILDAIRRRLERE